MESNKAEEYFYGFQNHFMDFGLDNLKKFMRELGDPQEKIRIIHIAGTNGKGSVSAYMSAILEQSGCRVGRYNSPAVFEKLENISINGKKITKHQFARQVEKMKPAIERAAEQNRLPTVFEMETALAYLWFAEEDCDVAVIECGLGGKFDATNVTNAEVLSIITSISMDHTAVLGGSLREIAQAKAGIIKKNIPCVTFLQEKEIREVLWKEAEEKHSLLIEVDRGKIERLKSSLDAQSFRYGSDSCPQQDYTIKMAGIYQTENAALAVEAAHILQKTGFFISGKQITEGLKKAYMPGRFQVIHTGDPLIILDGAHNPDAALRLRENMDVLLNGFHIYLVMGIFADKDYRKIVQTTVGPAELVYVVQAENERALDKEELAKVVRKLGKNVKLPGDIRTTINIAIDDAKKDSGRAAVLCFGSLSWLAQAKEAVRNIYK